MECLLKVLEPRNLALFAVNQTMENHFFRRLIDDLLFFEQLPFWCRTTQREQLRKVKKWKIY